MKMFFCLWGEDRVIILRLLLSNKVPIQHKNNE